MTHWIKNQALLYIIYYCKSNIQYYSFTFTVACIYPPILNHLDKIYLKKNVLRQLKFLVDIVCIVPVPADIRETAFVNAITAAGVTHAVTQACSMGDLLQCGCEATRNKAPPRPPSPSSSGDGVKWEWGGCGDDVEFGYEKSKQFMDAKRRRGRSDIRTLINLHNNEAGRLVRHIYLSLYI